MGLCTLTSRRKGDHRDSWCSWVTPWSATQAIRALATSVIPYFLIGIVWLGVGLSHSLFTRSMNGPNEKDASLLPGNITERISMELWAARREAEEIHSPRYIGASVSVSAKSITLETAPSTMGAVNCSRRRMVSSKARAVATTVLDAIVRAIEN